MSRVIIKNLPTDCREETLKELVSRYGTVTDVALKFTKGGVFRKFAFVGFLQEAEASNAVQLLDKTFLHSSRLIVQKASSLGDEEKPRSWSKYAKDSSLNVEAKRAREEEKATRLAKKNGKGGGGRDKRGNDELRKMEEDPEFAEFLKIHDINANRGATWGNDDDAGGGGGDGDKKKDMNTNATAKGGANVEDSREKEEGKGKETKKKKKKKKKDAEDNNQSPVVDAIKAEVKVPTNMTASDLDYLKSKQTATDIFSDDDDSDDEGESGGNESRGGKDKAIEKSVGSVVKDKDEEDEESDDDNEIDDNQAEDTADPVNDEDDERGEMKEKNLVGSGAGEKFIVKMRGLPFNAKEKQIREFFHPLQIRKPDAKPTEDSASFERDAAPWELKAAALKSDGDDALIETGRIFVRNLSYLCKQEDLESLFSPFGPIVETHLPLDMNSKKPKGFAFVTFMMPEHAVTAFNSLDGSVFQGRMLHLLPAKAKKETEEGDDASFKKKKEAELKKRSVQAHTWNSLFLGANAVADVVAEKYSTTKSAVLDADTRGSLAVRMALGETQIVNETRDFLIENGVCLDAFDGSKNAGAATQGKPQQKSQRSGVCLLAKNLPAGTTASEIGDLFSPFGTLARLVMPPSGITAIVEFQEPVEAKTAFRRLAYSKFKHLPLYLEWAPVGVFKPDAPKGVNVVATAASKSAPQRTEDDSNNPASTTEEADVDQAEPNATLYAKNLNFSTEDASLKTFFSSFGPVIGAVIARHKDAKTGEVLSRGYGFVQFQRARDAQAALKGLQGAKLDGHDLELKLSNRNGVGSGATASPTTMTALGEKPKQSSCITNVPSSKILVRNIPFEAKQKEIEELFKGFGELKSVRLPKKAVGKGKHRGFAFVEFLSKEDAKKAFDTFMHSTHLLGRRLVLEWAAEEEDVEAVRKRTAEKFGDGGDEEGGGVKRMKKATVDAEEFLKGKKKSEDS